MNALDRHLGLAAAAHPERENGRYDGHVPDVQPVGDTAAVIAVAHAEGVGAGGSTGVAEDAVGALGEDLPVGTDQFEDRLERSAARLLHHDTDLLSFFRLEA